MNKTKFLFSLIAIPLLAFALAANSLAKGPAGIIHDAEYYVLEAQHGEKWAKEDMEENFYPYGLKASEKSFEAAFRYVYDQGLSKRQVSLEEMFEKSTLDLEDVL